jgi:hypothetical protein
MLQNDGQVNSVRIAEIYKRVYTKLRWKFEACLLTTATRGVVPTGRRSTKLRSKRKRNETSWHRAFPLVKRESKSGRSRRRRRTSEEEEASAEKTGAGPMQEHRRPRDGGRSRTKKQNSVSVSSSSFHSLHFNIYKYEHISLPDPGLYFCEKLCALSILGFRA